MMSKTACTTIGLLLLCVLVACAGPENGLLPELDDLNTAPGQAFTADGLLFRKDMPVRRGWKPLEFYFKECSLVGARVYYSKTSYDCIYP